MTKTQTPPTFAEAVEKFRAAQIRWADQGAADSEPGHLFYDILGRFLNGHEPNIPTTAAGWDLYTGEKNVGLAATALRWTTMRALKAAATDTVGVLAYARDHGIRIF
jgi:hypothetical protein